jgi:fumarate reductase flavoprotein subunit
MAFAGTDLQEKAAIEDTPEFLFKDMREVGELMGGFHGVAHMTGSSLGKCVVFGRIAGRSAATVK